MHKDCTPYHTPARLAAYQARWRINESRIDGNVGYILLHHSGTEMIETMVDADLLPALLPLARWAAMRPDKGHPDYIYAGGWRRRQPNNPTHTKQLLYLHRTVMELSGMDVEGWEVDHTEGNTLDNRRVMLHVGTRQDNALNHYHSRNERLLRSVVRGLLTCGHTRQDCPCKRLAVAVLDQTERRTA